MDQFSYNIDDRNILVYRSIYAPVKSNMFTILTDKEAVVFDPNEDEALLTLLRNKGIEKIHILLTHGHYDHISGVEWLKDKTGAEVFCQTRCADRLANSKRPLARLVALVLAEEDKKDGGHRYQDFKESYKPFSITADRTFDKEKILEIGDLEFEVTSTPGHSEGSACYKLLRKMVFTGDTLLEDNAAITRFPGGNTEDYKNIALPYLRSLPKDSIIMPGHGDPFVLKDTKNI
jgi:glyoxylase-like metal-dependent hydrolase (beta-lactamase superfamily II)